MLLKSCCLTCNFFIPDKPHSDTHGTCFYAVYMYDMPFSYASECNVNPYIWHVCHYHKEKNENINALYK